MSETDTPEIRITAEPQFLPTNCKFRVDRSLYSGHLYTSDPAWAKEWSPLAAAIFSAVDGVRGIRIGRSEVMITMHEVPSDWREMARSSGSAIRGFLQGGGEAFKEGAAEALQNTDLVRHNAQTVIDDELNPGLASHGGWVEIQASDGADLYINMGGGCQGCSSAGETMQQGIEVAIRDKVPEVGNIFDSTDHNSGSNAYM